MSRKLKEKIVESVEEIVDITEVISNEEIQEETPLVDDGVSTGEVSEETVNEEVVEPVATEENPETDKDKTKYNKNIDFVGRGFSSFDKAKDFVKTDYFKGLGKEDQEEYLNWLKN